MDEYFDYNSLNDATHVLQRYCVLYGRLGGDAKEKYGSLRFYARFGYVSLHSLIYPGYVYNIFPQWLWNLDCRIIGPVLRFFLEQPFVWWQKKIYNAAYWHILKLFPHLRQAILVGADYPELIKGVTKKEGNNLIILGWRGEEIGRWTTL